MICKIYDKVCSSIVYSMLKVKPLLSLVCIARALCCFGGGGDGGGGCVCGVVVVVVALLLLLLLLL